ncbi:hypothetical protein OSTOST_03923, partial [Ostertagia ostertagi]
MTLISHHYLSRTYASISVSLSGVAGQIMQLKAENSNQRFLSIVASNLNSRVCCLIVALTLKETKEKELLLLLIRFLPHCYMPQSEIWSNGDLLSTAIESGCKLNVSALREAGCPVLEQHLHLLMECFALSLFQDLLVEPEYATLLVSEKFILNLIEHRSWSYLLRLAFSTFLSLCAYKQASLDRKVAEIKVEE